MTHDHTHAAGVTAGHTHDHSHRSTENYSARAHPEFVVLDIGEDTGALIIHTEPELHGSEIEISPSDDDGRRSHKDVLERSINGRAAFTAVFDQLRAGTYTLWSDGVARVRGVEVGAGTVGELDWVAATAGMGVQA